MSKPPIVNEKAWSNLLALAKEAGEEALVEIVNAFLGQLQDLSPRFAAAGRDAKALGALAHNLKSSAGGVGAERLSKMAELWEAEARQGKLPSPGAQAELTEVITATCQELQRRLAQRTNQQAA